MRYMVWEHTATFDNGKIVAAERPLEYGWITDEQIEEFDLDVLDEFEFTERFKDFTGTATYLSYLDELYEEVGFHVVDER